jgi:hypothetical protein
MRRHLADGGGSRAGCRTRDRGDEAEESARSARLVRQLGHPVRVDPDVDPAPPHDEELLDLGIECIEDDRAGVVPFDEGSSHGSEPARRRRLRRKGGQEPRNSLNAAASTSMIRTADTAADDRSSPGVVS